MVSKLKLALAHAAVPISQFLAAGAGGLGAVQLVNPSEEIRTGPINIEMTVQVGSQSTLLGEDLTDSLPFSVDVDLEVADLRDQPKAIEEITYIYGSDSRATSSSEIKAKIEELYGPDFDNALRNLGIKTVLLFSAGATTSVALTNFALKKINGDHINPGRTPIKKLAIPAVAIILAATTATILPVSKVDRSALMPRVEEILADPVEEFLLTGTSKMAVNFDTVSEGISTQLSRAMALEDALARAARTQQPRTDESASYLIVSDPHNLPTAPMLIEDLARAANVDGIIILGDFLNTGAQFEIEALFGIQIGETQFQGFDDIKSCKVMVGSVCDEEGNRFPIYGLSANHDVTNMENVFKLLGIIPLSTEFPEFLEGQVALDDACFVDDPSCQGEGAHAQRNQEKAGEHFIERDIGVDEGSVAPTVGFFAQSDAARVFEDNLEVIFTAGRHKFSSEKNGERVFIEVGSIGQGGPRPSNTSNAVIARFSRSPDGPVELESCTSAEWDLYGPPQRVSVSPCIE